MPIPQPTTDETKTDFIVRCLGDEIMIEEYPDINQRLAVCYEQVEIQQ
jgi:hypothetical protein